MNAENPLTGFKFFSEVNPETLESIGRMSQIVEYKAADVIFRFDEPAAHLYGVIEGRIDLSVVFKDKVLKTEIAYEEAIQANIVEKEKSIVVDSVLPGQVFGWASLVGSGRRTVTARCAQASRVFVLPATDLRTMFKADTALGYAIMKKLCNIISKRLQKRTDKLIETWVEAFDVDQI
jgi:CRP-like cAMP-binding protein